MRAPLSNLNRIKANVITSYLYVKPISLLCTNMKKWWNDILSVLSVSNIESVIDILGQNMQDTRRLEKYVDCS